MPMPEPVLFPAVFLLRASVILSSHYTPMVLHLPLTIATLCAFSLIQSGPPHASLSLGQAMLHLTPLLLCNPTTISCESKLPMIASLPSTFLLLVLFLPAVSNPLTLVCAFSTTAVSVPSSLKPNFGLGLGPYCPFSAPSPLVRPTYNPILSPPIIPSMTL